MPRGKFVNHKGRSRQFTPVEELQREQELEGGLLQQAAASEGPNLNKSHGSVDENNEPENVIRGKKMGGAVEGLIEISNPNRSIKKCVKFALLTKAQGTRGKALEDPVPESRPRREKLQRSSSGQKTSVEMNADLARLALVRKQREAAAELRLAAKRESESTLGSSKSDISLKKKTSKSNGNSSNSDYLKKDEKQTTKLAKGRNTGHNNRRMQASNQN